jgi:fatty acid desaturase
VKAHLKAIGMAMKQGTIIEHHIFPGLNSSYYPQLRRLLQEHYGDRYQLLPGSEAWRLLLATPRHYRSADVVCAADGSRAMRLPRLSGQTV